MKDRKQGSFRLRRGESVDDGVRRIALARIESAARELAGPEGTGPAAIHAVRKDMKKVRAVLRLVRGELGEEAFQRENRRYRDVGRLLAQSRDAEVKLQTLTALCERFDADLPHEAVKIWSGELERERNEATAAGGDTTLRVGEAITMIAAGREEIAGWPAISDCWSSVGAGLSRSYRDGRRRMKQARSRPCPEAVHAWRKRVKDLWYQLRILQGVWPEPVGEMSEQAHRLAELLGDHHDLTLLREDLARRSVLGEREALGGVIERRQQELFEAALDLGARLFAERPKAFAARFEAYWRAWRG